MPAGLDDGLVFDLDDIRAETIRAGDEYSGVRVRLVARLASAIDPFHVDVNIGDPIWPAPAHISLPRLLGEEPIRLRGYSLEMVLAEKIVTVLQRGQASTRWRDFGDIYLLTRRHIFQANQLRHALQAVADYRNVELSSLDDALDGYAEIGQAKWAAWRRRLELADSLPANFGDALGALEVFAEPILTGSADDSGSWDPTQRAWSAGS